MLTEYCHVDMFLEKEHQPVFRISYLYMEDSLSVLGTSSFGTYEVLCAINLMIQYL